MGWIEVIKAFFFGAVEGITEWLPISSTGHMILFDSFIRLEMSDAFKEMFMVVIQLGAILAVVVLFFSRLFPFSPGKTPAERKETLDLWIKVLVACVPAGIIGILFDDWLDELFYNSVTVIVTLIVYGVLFILLERYNRTRSFSTTNLNALSYPTAAMIGLCQLLALIPGTSRSGATILGAMLIGVSRPVAAEFSFFLAIPVMLGASALKLYKFGLAFSGQEAVILLVGMATAFLISIAAIQFLMGYIKRHDFTAFGYYRIALGIVLVVVSALIGGI